MAFSKADLSILRPLAEQAAALAACDKNRAVLLRWRDTNALRKPDRAPVWCRPVGAWDELLPESSLRCADPFLRRIEYQLRQLAIKADIGDDTPFLPYFPVPVRFDVQPLNIWGVKVSHSESSVKGGAWAYEPPLRTEEDFDKLVLPQFAVNHTLTQELLERTQEALGDALPVRRVCNAPLNGTLGTQAADLRGLEQMMLDMALSPELMHRLMAYLRDATLRSMDAAERSGMLTPNTDEPMTCSDAIGEDNEPVTFQNLWGMVNSQEFDQVSPAMWEEFCLEYQKPILARYGLTGYGCCENLTRKIPGVMSIPNLRIFVCSAWSNLDRIMEAVGTEKVIMWRQKASDVVFTRDTADLRAPLEEGLKKMQGFHKQVVLRELQTLCGNMDRLHVWTRLAIEAAEKYS